MDRDLWLAFFVARLYLSYLKLYSFLPAICKRPVKKARTLGLAVVDAVAQVELLRLVDVQHREELPVVRDQGFAHAGARVANQELQCFEYLSRKPNYRRRACPQKTRVALRAARQQTKQASSVAVGRPYRGASLLRRLCRTPRCEAGCDETKAPDLHNRRGISREEPALHRENELRNDGKQFRRLPQTTPIIYDMHFLPFCKTRLQLKSQANTRVFS